MQVRADLTVLVLVSALTVLLPSLATVQQSAYVWA